MAKRLDGNMPLARIGPGLPVPQRALQNYALHACQAPPTVFGTTISLSLASLSSLTYYDVLAEYIPDPHLICCKRLHLDTTTPSCSQPPFRPIDRSVSVNLLDEQKHTCPLWNPLQML